MTHDGGMEMPIGTVAPELVLVIGAVAVLLFALFSPRQAQAWAAVPALAALAAAAVASAVMLSGPCLLYTSPSPRD